MNSGVRKSVAVFKEPRRAPSPRFGQVYRRRIVVATDFTPATEVRFRAGIKISQAERCRAFDCSLLPYPWEPLFYAPGVLCGEMGKEMPREGQKNIDALTQNRTKGLKVHSLVFTELAEDSIVKAAKRFDVDLIVVGTQRRRGLSRVLWGSLAARMILSAPCPVLTVRSASTISKSAPMSQLV